MSAYIVDVAHIDALVTAAAIRSQISGPVSYWHDDEHHSGPVTRDDKTALGKMLMAENEKSIMYRYPDTQSDGQPLHDRMPGPAGYDGADYYQYPDTLLDPLDPVSLIKMIHCYEYQSCEHPGWKTSRAKAFCDALLHRQMQRLPGYDSAPWNYTYPAGRDPRKGDLPKVISLLDLAR
jgi:hypothetical protein